MGGEQEDILTDMRLALCEAGSGHGHWEDGTRPPASTPHTMRSDTYMDKPQPLRYHLFRQIENNQGFYTDFVAFLEIIFSSVFAFCFKFHFNAILISSGDNLGF